MTSIQPLDAVAAVAETNLEKKKILPNQLSDRFWIMPKKLKLVSGIFTEEKCLLKTREIKHFLFINILDSTC